MSEQKNDLPLWDLPVAWVLLTRLPLPRLPQTAFDRGARAVWAYSVVGLILGGLAAAILGGLQAAGVAPAIAAGITLTAVMMATGAMHEDGLADTADGLWGGFTPERRLEIMKDSRIGTYGVLALIVGIGMRWLAWADCDPVMLIYAFSMSRAAMPVLMYALPHARADGLSRAVGRPDPFPVIIGLSLACVVGGAAVGAVASLAAMAVAALCVCGLGWLAKTKLGGQSGDILGATQIVTEIAILVTLITLVSL